MYEIGRYSCSWYEGSARVRWRYDMNSIYAWVKLSRDQWGSLWKDQQNVYQHKPYNHRVCNSLQSILSAKQCAQQQL